MTGTGRPDRPRALRVAAARQKPIDPYHISFTGTLRVLCCRLLECASRQPEALALWYRRLLWEISYAKKHPYNRGAPSACKPFPKTVVMLIERNCGPAFPLA